MELFKSTRLKIGNNILRRKCSRIKRIVYYSNISKIKSVGIVWDSSNPDEFACLSRFHQKMQDRNIDVRVIGFFNGKELPDKYTAVRYLTCIRKNEINLFYIPNTTDANNFINKKFDILIDINFKKVFPLYYILKLSVAGFKVGIFEHEDLNSPFELMMEIKKPVNTDNYLNEVIHYLEMINS
jgi:hypothetical protein